MIFDNKTPPGPPGYCSMDGMPWVASQMWFDALTGGKLNMKMLPEPAQATLLPALTYRNLTHPRFAAEGRGFPLNPTIVDVGGGRLLTNVRVCSKSNHQTHNYLCTVGEDGTIDGQFLTDRSGFGPTAYGFEDIRLFMHKGQLHGVSAISLQGTNGNPRTLQALLRINPDEYAIEAVTMLDSPRHEKNWMACIKDNELRFVYATVPLMVLAYDDEKKKVGPEPKNLPELAGVIRGSSQLIPYRDGYLSVVHQIHAKEGAIRDAIYVHRFAFFDQDLLSAKLSTPFYFKNVGIEFCSGLAQRGDNFLIAYGVADQEAWIAEVSPETVAAYVDGAVEPPKMPLQHSGVYPVGGHQPAAPRVATPGAPPPQEQGVVHHSLSDPNRNVRPDPQKMNFEGAPKVEGPRNPLLGGGGY